MFLNLVAGSTGGTSGGAVGSGIGSVSSSGNDNDWGDWSVQMNTNGELEFRYNDLMKFKIHPDGTITAGDVDSGNI